MFGTEVAGGVQSNPLKWDWNNFIVVPTKSDSDVMFSLQSVKGLNFDRSLVY